MTQNNTSETPRWVYRFENYKRAFLLLREAIETMQEQELTQLEKEGMIQRFEYTLELAWKVLKDYLSHEGVVLDKETPRFVIREAFSAKIITQGELWQEALDARNKMSHTYDFEQFEQVIQKIRNQYLGLFDDLHFSMLQNLMEEPNSQA